ncbi:MAG TPA: hypothetical protein VL422_16090 [Miltoncostaea sp.]|nr:hypothetical protein [Miltoncostaea sp.]
MTGPDRIAAPVGTPSPAAAVASALPRRTAADAHAPAPGAAPAAAPGARADAGGGTPDPHGVSGRLIDVFA